MIRALACFVAALLLGCDSEPDSPAQPQREAPVVARPNIEFAGCRHVEPGVCYLRAKHRKPKRLHVWIDMHAKATVEVRLDTEMSTAEGIAVDGGQRFDLTIPDAAEALTIAGVDPPWAEPFVLRFEREPVPAVIAATASKPPEAVIAALEAALPESEGLVRLAILQSLRRRLWVTDRTAAKQLSERTFALARELGRSRDAADAASALAGSAVGEGDSVRGHEWTEALEPFMAELPEARVWWHYYRGGLETRTGDLGGAVLDLGEASRLAERLGMSAFSVPAREQLATVLAELGRSEEALELLRTIVAEASGPGVSCEERARTFGNAGWAHLLLATAGHEHDPPRRLLERQHKLVTEGGECPSPNSLVRFNLALVALAEDEPEEAWSWLSEQRARSVPPHLRAWDEEIAAQIGRETGRDELVPALVQRPVPTRAEPGLLWMALVRHAQTLDALGMREAAIDNYVDAEAVLEELFSSVGVDYGSELFLAGRLASAEGLVELLIADGQVEHAFCRARVARGRALRTIDRSAKIASLSPKQRARREQLLYEFLAVQDSLTLERREDWKFSTPEREHRERRRAERATEAEALLDEALRLVGGSTGFTDCEELPNSPAGVLTLLHFPRPADQGGAWIFVADSEGVRVQAVTEDALRRDAWTPALLEPFADRIAAARVIRVMPTSAGWALPFHAMPFADGVLLDVAPVVYALDLPPRSARSHSTANAVVVADPTHDLQYAREEADEIVARLRDGGWSVEHLHESAATRAGLTEALQTAGLLHYAGHGTHGGVDGWAASLVLHDGDRLTVSDILALPRVPAAVVLSGCDTATVDEATIAGGMNLGRAFVLAGSSWVIAADGRVDDELARSIGTALYDQLDTPKTTAPLLDGAEALRRVQLRLREQYPNEWQAFRAVVP